jgi:hypothetical protein
MRRWGIGTKLVGLLMLVIVSGCDVFEDPVTKETENAENTALWERADAYEAQETLIVALQETVDSSVNLGATATQSANRVNVLQSTVVFLETQRAGRGNSGSVFNSSQQTPAGGQPVQTAVGGGVPAGQGPTQASDGGAPSSASYSQTHTSATLTDDFCAGSPLDTFNVGTADVVHFGTLVQNLQAGTRFSMRVSNSSGQVLDLDSNFWTSDQFYAETCVYYSLNSDNLAFIPGRYIVELLANDQPVTQAAFTLIGGDQEEDMMDDEG